jgi:hypothetical protein
LHMQQVAAGRTVIRNSYHPLNNDASYLETSLLIQSAS